MGGPGVEWTSAGWSAPQPPNPQPLTPSGRETLASIGSQGLLLCTEQAEAGVMATAQDRITITARRTTVATSSNSGRPKAMRLQSQYREPRRQ
jgi:hypothetical protein